RSGRASLSAGRLLEGHVNAIRLIVAYGTGAQLAHTAADVGQGHCFAIWATEAAPGVRCADGSLSGRKVNVSAVGLATRAVITVGRRLLVVHPPGGSRAGEMPQRLCGLRELPAGWVDFGGYRPAGEDWLGGDDDYLREPEFSAGAWRTLAVIAGGIAAASEEM